MVKIDAPPYAGPLVLVGALAALWGAVSQVQTHLETLVLAQKSLTATAETIQVTATNTDGTGFTGTVQIVTASGTILDNITVTSGMGTGTELRISVPVDIEAVAQGIMSNIITIPALSTVTLSHLTLAQQTLTATDDVLTVTATQSDGSPWTGSVNIQTTAGTVLDITSVTGGTGTTAPILRVSTPLIVEAAALGVTSNTVTIPATTTSQAKLHITAGTLTATHETINLTATNALGVPFSGNVSIITAAGTTVATSAMSNGVGTASVPRTTLAVVVHAHSAGLPNSNTLTIPALGTGGLTALHVALGTTTATTAVVHVTATPLTFSGTVALNRNAVDTFVTNVTVTAGHGQGTVPRLATGLQNNIHAYDTAFAIRSNNLPIPPLQGGVNLTSLSIAQASLTASAESIRITARPTNWVGTVDILSASGTVLDTVPVSGGTATASIPRIQVAQVVHANSGTINSGTLTVPALTSQAVLTIARQGISGAQEAINVTSAVNVLGVNFNGTVDLVNVATGSILATVSVSNGISTTPGIVQRIQVAQIVEGRATGLPNSNQLTVPALAAVASLQISPGTLTASSENINISATNALGVPYSGPVNLVNSSSGTILDQTTVTNGTGSGNILRISVDQPIEAQATGLPNSNIITVPAGSTSQFAVVDIAIFNGLTGVSVRGATVRLSSALNTYTSTSNVNGNAHFASVAFDTYNLFAVAGALSGGKSITIQSNPASTSLGIQ